MRYCFFLGLSVLCVAPCVAQQASGAAAAGSAPKLRAARPVLVDALVTDKKGKYLEDLKPEEFQIFEDDKPQTISSFSYESDAASPEKVRRHHLVILLDYSNMQGQDPMRARDAAARFIEANSGPGRLIAIVEYRGGLSIAQNFTEDAALLQRALRGEHALASQHVQTAGAEASSLVRSESDFGLRSTFLGIDSLARTLTATPGRKSVLMLTAQIAVTPGTESEFSAAINACNRANVAIYPVDVRGMDAVGRDSANVVRAKAAATGSDQAANPNDLLNNTLSTRAGDPDAVYTRGRGLEMPNPSGASLEQHGLRRLSGDTGGFPMLNSNDLLASIERIGQEQSQYYLLGYVPPESAPGSCHSLRVKVTRPGARVRARSGYCGAHTHDMLRGRPIEKELESRIAAEVPGDLKPAVLAPYFYSSPAAARANVVLEIPSAAIEFKKVKGNQHAETNILGIACRQDGSIGARFSDSIKLDFEGRKEMDAFRNRPFRFETQFEIEPGSYTLKVVVSTGPKFGKAELPLSIDPWDGQKFTLSGVALSRDIRPAPASGPSPEPEISEGRTPLVADNMRFVPSGSTRLKRSDQAGLYLEVYAPLLMTDTPPQVGVRVSFINKKTGETKRGFMNVAKLIRPGQAVVPVPVRLPLENLEPGLYRAELQAQDSVGNLTTLRTSEFELE